MKGSVLSTRTQLCYGINRRLCTPLAAQSGENGRSREVISQTALGFLSAAALSLSLALGPAELGVWPAAANLPSGVTVTSAKALLRNALPISNKPIRDIQRQLEAIDEYVRIPGNTGFSNVVKAANSSLRVAKDRSDQILADVAPSKKEEAAEKLQKLKEGLPELAQTVETKIKDNVLYKQQELLDYVGFIEESMVKEFPFTVPSEYSEFPQLKGRADVEMKVNFKEKFRGDEVIMKIVVDGYNAPITAGSFIDLVQKKFYDGMEIQRADGFVVQTGKPDDGEFYIDPKTNKPRKIPLEVKVAKDKEPIYEFSLEDLGRPNDSPALPFNAFGTMAMARSEFDNNSGSCQIFFLLKESELTPAGSNLLDGRYAVFGYVVEGQDALGNMKVGDKIEYVKVVRGAENLKA